MLQRETFFSSWGSFHTILCEELASVTYGKPSMNTVKLPNDTANDA
jgi:hypothetical protein